MSGTTDLKRVKAGARFTWGRVVAIHEIGPYSIVEYHGTKFDGVSPAEPPQEEEEPSFHPYVDGKDWSHTYTTLDEALCACIAVRRGGYHAQSASHYMMRLVDEDPDVDPAVIRALVRKVGDKMKPRLDLRRKDGGKGERWQTCTRERLVGIWRNARSDHYCKTADAVEDRDWLLKELED